MDKKLIIGFAVLAAAIIAGIVLILVPGRAQAPASTSSQEGHEVSPDAFNSPNVTIRGNADVIRLESPASGSVVSSPLVVSGEARGSWYFEASFPVMLTDWDGRIIAQGTAKAQGDWMTTNFVPFEATLSFTAPISSASIPDHGVLILKKDNPSGLPAKDDALEIPVRFLQR